MATIFDYWGKARPQPEGEAQWHLLPYHALDVAAVGLKYLQAHPRLSGFFADGLGCPPEETHRWLTFWLALHDLGKFTAAFQSQRPDIVERLQGQRERSIGSYPINGLKHDSLGAMLWRRLLSHHDVLGMGGGKASLLWERSAPWIEAVTGHHGEPPETSGNLFSHCHRSDEQAAAAFVEAVLQLLGRDALLATLEKVGAKLKQEGARLSWWLAGLAVLADWIGSNTRYFPYRDKECDLGDYWCEAQQRAQLALRETGVLPQPAASTVSVQALFGADNIPTLTPLQAWAESQPLAAGPQLFLLEDVTGAGKTEAALTLAARLMSCGWTAVADIAWVRHEARTGTSCSAHSTLRAFSK